MKVQIRKSKRARRIAIRVEASGLVELVLPMWASNAQGMKFVQERQDWILKMMYKQQQERGALDPVLIRDGATIPCFGDELIVVLQIDPDRKRMFVKEHEGTVTVYVPKRDRIVDAIIGFYTAQAKNYFAGQSVEYAERINKHVGKIRVIDMKTQWGSCNTATHALTYNWRLAIAPEHIARYVTAHEVAHLMYGNHSPAFWNAVKSLDPSYATSRAWLKNFGASLVLTI